MARINVDIGARLAASFQSTLSRAKASVSSLAEELSAPFLKVSRGASVTSVALDHVKDKIVSGMLGPVGSLAYGLGAVNIAMWALQKASNAVAGSIEKFRSIEDLEGAFRPLLGSLQAARTRIADLANFANKTPFNLPEVASASRVLQVLTRGALATGEGLRIVGDASAASGTSFQEMAMWIGRAYDGLQSGRPIGEAAMRLQELGVLSGTTRTKIEELQKAGKSGGEVWAVLRKELDRTNGAMEVLATTVTGLRSTLQDAKDTLYREFGKSFVEYEKETIKGTTEVLENMVPIAEHAGEVLNDLGIADSPGEWFPVADVQLKKLIATVLSASGVIKGLIDAVVIAGGALSAMVVASTIQSLWGFYVACKANVIAVQQMIAAQKAQQIVWNLSFASILANTRQLAQNAIANGRGAVAAYLQAGATIALKAAIDSVTASLRTLYVSLILNPWVAFVGVLAAAVGGMYIYLKSVEDAEKRHSALTAETKSLTSAFSEQRKSMETATDKAKLLSAAYEELRKAQEAAANATPEDRDALDSRALAIQREIKRIESTDDGKLKASEDRARFEKEVADLVREHQMAEMTGEQKLLALLGEKNRLLKEQKELQENLSSAEYEQQQIPRLNAELENQGKVMRDARLRRDEAQRKIEVNRAGNYFSGPGGSSGRPGTGELEAELSKAQAEMDAALSAIKGLQARKANMSPNKEAAATALASKNLEVQKAEFAEGDQRKKNDEEAETIRLKLEELRIEKEIANLGGSGVRRAQKEWELRRAQLTTAMMLAKTEGERVELRAKLEAEGDKVTTAIKTAKNNLADARRDRREAMEKALFDRLNNPEKMKVLGDRRAAELQDAAKYDARAAAAKKAGNDGESAEFSERAERARKRADELGFDILDLKSKSEQQRPTTDSLRKIGGGGLVSGMGKDPSIAIREKEVKAVESLNAQIKRLNDYLEKRPTKSGGSSFAD